VTDLTAFKDLYTRLFSVLCQKAYAYVHDADAAKDIVQEVFVRYWSSRPEVATIAEAYLYKAVINQCLNYIDAHKRRSAATLNYSHTRSLSVNTVEEAVATRELREKINRLILELPTVCRNVFLLSRYEGMDHKAIGEHLSISPNTVDNHIKRALKHFRENLP
jgi:RNA polymerase sigma-70 factor (family 1)